MKNGTLVDMNNAYYTLAGTAKDIETIIRIRPWIEDEISCTYGNFVKTQLLTDYDSKNDIFSFKIQFYK
jgi:hypothetical protein